MRIFQPTVTGSFAVSGSVYFPALVTSSVAISDVVVFGANGELFVTSSSAIGGGGSGAGFPYSGSAVITGSLLVSGSGLTVTGSLNADHITGSLYGTASWANNTITSQTASYSTNFTAATSLIVDGALVKGITYQSTIVGSNNLFQQATGSYTSAHGKYTIHKGTNARAGEFVTVWNSNLVEYYDNSTNDIGNTEDITFQSSIVTGQIKIDAVAVSSGWTVKMLITYV
jgi:hypothetical protein